MYKTVLLTTALLTIGESAWAQQQPPVGAGGQLQQIPMAPVAPPPAPDIEIRHGTETAAPQAGGPKIRVASLHVFGAAHETEQHLIAISGFVPDTELDLAGLRTLAGRITAFYNRQGYFLARAYIPEQDIRSGSVTIAVIEGRYGKISLDNRARLDSAVANGIIGGLQTGAMVTTAPLERRLLLLSDLPGVRVRSTLSPGQDVGTSDLQIALSPGPTVTGSIEGDNSGNRYTGAYRAGGTINVNNLTGHGDVFTLRGLTSFDGLYYGRASYQAPIGQATVGLAYSHIYYELGREFKSLDASGNGDVASVYASYPLIRSRSNNLYALINGDSKWFEDKFGSVDTVSHRRTQVVTLGLSGDEHDHFGGGGSTVYSVGIAYGNLDIRDAADRAADDISARSNGGYGKVQYSLSRLQTVIGPLSAFGWVRGQFAFNNLDISEKMELGGASGVRAYPEGEAYGDQGYVATAEARLRLPPLPLPGQFQLFGFVDAGQVNYAKDPWYAGSNRARRSAYGGGAIWAAPANFTVKGTYARKLGDEVATSAPDSSGRFWFQISKLF
ncbi:ShlB/FhaC/HecB family hemolysin secretion/activation protein [Novosphingobium sp.]|uniref:ShlB/FhaC/HecB family hemolysin secretion/activation protein n=1 Tax=Novosphingobium sp. TaxID=1874826 RepID=UPI003D110008